MKSKNQESPLLPTHIILYMYGSVKAVIHAIYCTCLCNNLDSDATFLTRLCATHADYVTRDAEARSWELRWVLGLS